MNFNENRWTAAEAETLRKLWAQNNPRLSEIEIGKIMRRSKNSINSKRKLIKLPGRESPIKRRLSVMSLAEPPPGVTDSGDCSDRAVDLPPVVMPMSAESRLLAGRLGDARESWIRYCSWPIGEPGTSGFQFCDAVRADGRVYCEGHAATAYVRYSGVKAA